jgi:hypothetical protein
MRQSRLLVRTGVVLAVSGLEDRIDATTFNEAIWQGVKGAGSAIPAPQQNVVHAGLSPDAPWHIRTGRVRVRFDDVDRRSSSDRVDSRRGGDRAGPSVDAVIGSYGRLRRGIPKCHAARVPTWKSQSHIDQSEEPS